MMLCHFCFLFINCFSFLSLVCMCNTYPRLISSCSSGSELYALSRHRCCCILLLFPLPDLGSYDDGRRCLITMLSTTFVTSLMSWVLAEDMITVVVYLFYLLKSVFLCPVCLFCQWWDCFLRSLPPPKGDFMDMESSDCHVQLIPKVLS